MRSAATDKRLGWVRDFTDCRDFHPKHPDVKAILQQSRPYMKATAGDAGAIASTIDLRAQDTPVYDQGQLGSCTANAGAGILAFCEKKAFWKFLVPSRLFIYKATRDLTGAVGDIGAQLRTTMQAIAMFGAPPEQYLPYDISKFDDEPPAFLYAMGSNYKGATYYRHDPIGATATDALASIKSSLTAGIPCMFGTSVYSSFPGIDGAPDDGNGNIPYPSTTDSAKGGHAMVVLGFDDNRTVQSDKGVFIVRNSWSSGWGAGGYGYMPYRYLTDGLASDFWSLVTANFIDTDLFA